MQDDMSEVHSQETPVKFPSHSQTPLTQLPWSGGRDERETVLTGERENQKKRKKRKQRDKEEERERRKERLTGAGGEDTTVISTNWAVGGVMLAVVSLVPHRAIRLVN